MVAIIGHPGSTNHRWRRFADKKEAIQWLDKVGQKMYEDSGGLWPDALSSQRVISEKVAATIKYRDGKQCYSRELERCKK